MAGVHFFPINKTPHGLAKNTVLFKTLVTETTNSLKLGRKHSRTLICNNLICNRVTLEELLYVENTSYEF